MRLETFFEKFETLAEMPGAVGKLRELVLELAATGRLLPREQDWEFRPLKTLATKIGSGSTPAGGRESYHEKGVPLIRSMNVHFSGFEPTGLVFLSEEQAKQLANVTVQANDVLLNITGASIGRVTTAPPEMAGARVNQHVAIIRSNPSLFPRFLANYLASPSIQRMIDSIQIGATRQALTKAMIEQFEIPVPPIAEQEQIVARVDDLMALCDRLEAQQQERETRHTALARAALARFADAPNPTNLQLLFHPSYTITPADLRKSILSLAIQGKLVTQDSSDESALVLLEQIATHKAALAKEGKLRGSTAVKPMANDEVGFELPSNWCWVRFGEIMVNRDGERIPVSKEEREAKAKIYDYYGASGVIDKIDGYLFDKPLLLIGEDGANLINRSTPIAFIARGKYWVNNHAHVLDGICEDFLKFIGLHINAINLENYVTGSAQPKMNQAKMNSIPIALPPLAEQRRILRRVDQLMALVDALETELSTARTSAAGLLSALVAELTDIKLPIASLQLAGPDDRMKDQASAHDELETHMEPLNISTESFVLRRFAMTSGYRSLGKFDCAFHSDQLGSEEASPICLVGLNGSGKSNLIEAVAEVFCFLELINLPWKKLASPSSRYRENRHHFELEYTLTNSDGERLIRVRKTRKKGVDFFVVTDDGTEEAVPPGRPQLLLLPRRVIGYSSGLNETVSHPFLRTKTIYSEEVRDAAPPEGAVSSQGGSVFDTRALYMDYESNAAVIICNYIFREASELTVFNEFTRVSGVSSFGLRFNRKRAGKSGPNSIVRLTRELQSYQESFARCAGVKWDAEKIAYSLNFDLTPETIRRFRDEFETAENLFMAMHKWSLLNALILSDEQRNVYLSADITKGALERPPSVPPSDRVFNIVDLKLNLSMPATEIDYSGLSDGEHQFMQIIGTALLFSAPGTLFLLDEPESHFNPEWRTKFNLILNKLPNARDQEYIVSTHSPFVVSGSRMGNVYKFERTGGETKCAPVQFETYGASFDVLLKNLFSINSLIDQSAREDLERIIKSGDAEQMQAAVGDFAESKEKRRLYEAILQKGASEE